MASILKLTVEVKTVTRYCFIFFPIATFAKIGEVELLTVFGLPIYKKVGEVRALFGFIF